MHCFFKSAQVKKNNLFQRQTRSYGVRYCSIFNSGSLLWVSLLFLFINPALVSFTVYVDVHYKLQR